MSKPTVKNCTTCDKAVFDHLWGEYKCKLDMRRVYDPEKMNNCPSYKKAGVEPAKKGGEEYGEC